MSRKLLGVASALVLGVTATAIVPGAAQATSPAPDGPGETPPIVFVHGFMGSGAQFEAPALRFVSNGYPADHIEMLEHDSLAWPAGDDDSDEATLHREFVWSRLDEQIDDLLAATGADQVVLGGHSQGTATSLGYLNASPERLGRVVRYINLDGSSGGDLPESMEALAIWSQNTPDGELAGATNIHYVDQGHTEVVNSPESFAHMYEFVTGDEPFATDVVREPAGEIVVGGRAVLFPQNVGADTATLDIYEVAGETGLRLGDEPAASFELDETGAWGPFEAGGDVFYEFALTRPDTDSTHHIYPQQFVRSNPWMRVLTSEPGGLADGFWGTSDDHVNLVILRNKEWWGDQGDEGDRLTVAGEELMTDVIAPRDNSVIGIFVHDDGVDGQSDLTTPVAPSGLPFLAGVNLHLPAADPPDATIAVVATPRGGDGDETVCVPNYASTDDRISVAFDSYHHTVNPDGSPAAGRANPTCA